MTVYLLHGYAHKGDAKPELTLESKPSPFYVDHDRVYSLDYEGKEVHWLTWMGGPRHWMMDAATFGFPDAEDRYLRIEWFTIEAKATLDVPIDVADKIDQIDARLAVLLNYLDDRRREEVEGIARTMRSEVDMATAADDLLAMYESDVIPLVTAGNDRL